MICLYEKKGYVMALGTISLKELAKLPDFDVEYVDTIEVQELKTGKRERFYRFGPMGFMVEGMGATVNDAGLLMIRASLGAGKAEELANQMMRDTVAAYIADTEMMTPKFSMKMVENGEVVTHGFN